MPSEYINEMKIIGSTGREYKIAQHAKARWWACSCPRWITTKKQCRHLKAQGIPGNYEPYELPAPTPQKKKFSMDQYTYAPNGASGNPEQWRDALSQLQDTAAEPTPAAIAPTGPVRKIRRLSEVA